MCIMHQQLHSLYAVALGSETRSLFLWSGKWSRARFVCLLIVMIYISRLSIHICAQLPLPIGVDLLHACVVLQAPLCCAYRAPPCPGLFLMFLASTSVICRSDLSGLPHLSLRLVLTVTDRPSCAGVSVGIYTKALPKKA